MKTSSPCAATADATPMQLIRNAWKSATCWRVAEETPSVPLLQNLSGYRIACGSNLHESANSISTSQGHGHARSQLLHRLALLSIP